MITTSIWDIGATLLWITFGMVMIMVILAIIDFVMDRIMKRNWFSIANLADHPSAMAIFAAGIMITIAIIIHAAILSESVAPLP